MKKTRDRSATTNHVKKQILDTGVEIWPDVTAREIARRLDMSHPNIGYHFGDTLKDAVAEHAVKTGNSRVIAQLIATKHPAVQDMSPAVRKMHMLAAS